MRAGVLRRSGGKDIIIRLGRSATIVQDGPIVIEAVT